MVLSPHQVNTITMPLALNQTLIQKLDYYTMLEKNGLTYIHQFGGFSAQELKNVLNFFNNAISTRFVILSACYIGGQALHFYKKAVLILKKL